MTGIEIGSAISIAGALLKEALAINELIKKAQTEKRDITPKEWASLDLAQKEAHSALSASIEARELDEVSGD